MPAGEGLVSASTVSKYLRVHAEPEAGLARAVTRSYRHVIVIPASGEEPSLWDGLVRATDRVAGEALCIVVVNGHAELPLETHQLNRQCIATLNRRAEARPIDAGAWLGRIDAADVLLIDRASPERIVPRKQGVGLARKIGCDVALGLRHAGKSTSRWIHTSDADVGLPADYFTAAADVSAPAAALAYRFEHATSSDSRLDRAHALYECYLRYYVLGLAHAGSPYACHTIGSILAIDASAYAGVRGFPRREAAEDFYLVNKLLKLGPVSVPSSEPIAIRPRRSSRVPFGTGRATGDMLDRELDRGDDYAIYHPRCFVLLRAWLEALSHHAATGDDAIAAASRLLHDAVDRACLAAALASLDVHAGLDKALREAPARDRRRRAHEWFDAFRTRKLVHALRDGVDGGPALGVLPWREGLERAPFIAARFDHPREAMRALAARESGGVSGPGRGT
jgi:hypothetical protein